MGAELHAQSTRIAAAINAQLFNASSGLYVDGADGTGAPVAHSAWHASVFPVAFGLVPRERWPKLLAFFRAKGMAGSVYAAYWCSCRRVDGCYRRNRLQDAAYWCSRHRRYTPHGIHYAR